MSEPKVLHEWSEDGIDWAIVKDEHGCPGVLGRTNTRWWSTDGRDLRALAAEILRLREQLAAATIGEEMSHYDLRVLIEDSTNDKPWSDDFEHLETYVDFDALCKVLLRRKEQP